MKAATLSIILLLVTGFIYAQDISEYKICTFKRIESPVG